MLAKLKNWLNDKFSTGESALPNRSKGVDTHAGAPPQQNTKAKPVPSVDPDEDTGIDPYNTGSFDRSRNWNNRYRK